MENIYLCPHCGEPTRTLRLQCWLRLLEAGNTNERALGATDDNLHFVCRGCAQPLVIPRDAPLAAA